MRRLRSDEGISVVEFSLVLPVLLLVLAVTAPLVMAGWEYLSVSRATAHGVRYASRVDVNARESSVGLTRRPTSDEVDTFVREAADGIELKSVTVSPEPAGALPGEIISLTVTHEISYGPLAELANAVSEFIGGGALLPESAVVTVTAQGREE